MDVKNKSKFLGVWFKGFVALRNPKPKMEIEMKYTIWTHNGFALRRMKRQKHATKKKIDLMR
jgi:hypothetical protein